MSSSATGAARAAFIALTMTLLLAGGLGAQSPAPPSAPATCDPFGVACPTPSPESGIDWPPMQFAGGDPAQLVWTSTCGIWGQDPITLIGAGGAGSAVHVVTFDEYEVESAQWFGRVTGTFTSAVNGLTSPIDDGALIYYAFDLGQWILVAGLAAQIPGPRVRSTVAERLNAVGVGDHLRSRGANGEGQGCSRGSTIA